MNGYLHTFPAFKLLELRTNSTLAGFNAYTLVGTYKDVKDGPQKIQEVGTILDHEAYYIQYIASVSKGDEYLPIFQKMVESLIIKRHDG